MCGLASLTYFKIENESALNVDRCLLVSTQFLFRMSGIA